MIVLKLVWPVESVSIKKNVLPGNVEQNLTSIVLPISAEFRFSCLMYTLISHQRAIMITAETQVLVLKYNISSCLHLHVSNF